GYIYLKESESLLEEIKDMVVTSAKELQEKNVEDRKVWKKTISQALDTFLNEKTGGRPILLPVIIEV
ncbi:MAG: hypothetical protein UMV23_03350, partial [Halanaerobium sp.]|nr:hypothetical protein [Halanaerobium sp.]